jgi:alpha-beta hydrolase superfamily lysophospholipase
MIKKKFKSKDGLLITANYYPIEKPIGFILLCHRSHYSKAEYKEIAPQFNELGYSCLAIDQRSGMNFFNDKNETSTLAKSKSLPTSYIHAIQDIQSAIDYSYKLNQNKQILILGSSYSASICLYLGIENKKIKAILAFSPGEYLKGIELQKEIAKLKIFTFITSSKKEIPDTKKLIRKVSTQFISYYIPKSEGFHGAKNLKTEEYWKAVKKFLKKKEVS